MTPEEAFKSALAKMAEAPKNNENDTLKGVANVRTQPEDRAPGTLDAKWGDDPPEGHNGYPDVYSTAVMREAKDGRGELIERMFDSPKAVAAKEQALMRQYFENAGEGDPHSPMLQRGNLPLKHAHAEPETLTDQVNRVIGFR